MNFFEDEQIVIKLRFIVFKMTAQITKNSTTKKRKMKGGPDIRKITPKSPKMRGFYFGGSPNPV